MDCNDIITKLDAITRNFNFIINNDEEDFLMTNNVDSITFVEFVINIESEFSILISEEYMIAEKMNTISKMVRIIEGELAGDSNVQNDDPE